MADQSAGPVARSFKVYDFAALSRREPNRQQPGDRLDAQFDNLIATINSLARAVELQADAIVRLRSGARAGSDPAGNPLADPLEGPQALGPNAGGSYATDQQGATATSADYAQVSIAWAENMPWTIPGNILAINAITGDHWSSRWWANRCAMLVASIGNYGLARIVEQATVTAVNTLAPLANPPASLSTVEVIVNGRVFSGAVTPPPFTVSGNSIVWNPAQPYSINPGDEVVVDYQTQVPLPKVAQIPAISLYYIAAQGQSSFSLNTPDRYGGAYTLLPTSSVHVYVGGVRMMQEDPGGFGDFTVAGNEVVLRYPAAQGAEVVIDVWENG